MEGRFRFGDVHELDLEEPRVVPFRTASAIVVDRPVRLVCDGASVTEEEATRKQIRFLVRGEWVPPTIVAGIAHVPIGAEASPDSPLLMESRTEFAAR